MRLESGIPCGNKTILADLDAGNDIAVEPSQERAKEGKHNDNDDDHKNKNKCILN